MSGQTPLLPPFTFNPLPIKPPIIFNNLSVKMFPLRASLDALQQVCDGYLNIVPHEAGYFRAAAPYVLLGVLNYGQIAESAKQFGWFAQVEVYFSISVEWYRKINGHWQFHDYAVITPYIFVDDSYSAPLGRTVYGFPKILSRVVAAENEWLSNAGAPMVLTRVETSVFQEAYAGMRLDMAKFLEVEREPPLSSLHLPFDARSPFLPWNIAGNLVKGMAGLGRDMARMAQAPRIFHLDPMPNPLLLAQQMMGRIMPAMKPTGRGFAQNSINLKQFRKADDPSRIGYQALTNGRMYTMAVKGLGVLGDDRVLLGDTTGGYSVRLYNNSTLPIADVLGLEVDHTHQTASGKESVLKPVMPFWMNVDVTYEKGETLAWRTHDGVWKDREGTVFPNQAPAPAEAAPLFNNTVVSAIEAIAGPFEFPDTTIRVLPLLARRDVLQQYLDDYLNRALEDGEMAYEDGKTGEKTPERIRFSVWSRPAMSVRYDSVDQPGPRISGDNAYVYLTASSFGGVTSKTNNVGDWANYEVSFLIPVKMERWRSDGVCASEEDRTRKDDSQGLCQDPCWETAGVGLVPYATLVDQPIAAISRMEVQGINALTAHFVRPESVWLGAGDAESCLDPKQTLLRVDTEVTVAAAQQSQVKPLIEIRRRETDAGLGEAPSAEQIWTELLRRELGPKNGLKVFRNRELKVGRALALEILGNETPIQIYTLKQFRDVSDPDKACLQTLLRVPRSLNRTDVDVQEIEDTLVVRLHDYPNLRVVEELGLYSSRLPQTAAGIVYSIQAIRPFFIRATLREELSERVATRAGERNWKVLPGAFDTLLGNRDLARYSMPELFPGDYSFGDGGKPKPDPSLRFHPEDSTKLKELFDAERAPRIAVDGGTEFLQDRQDPANAAKLLLDARERRHWLEVGQEAPSLIWMSPPTQMQPIEYKDISKAIARHVVNWVDPQSVIEAVLSREWCNHNPKSRWRKGRRYLAKQLDALSVGGAEKARVERALLEQINNDLALRPRSVAHNILGPQAMEEVWRSLPGGLDRRAGIAWRSLLDEVLTRQEEFTGAREELEQLVEALQPFFVLGFQDFRPQVTNSQEKRADLLAKGDSLVKALRKVSELRIVGKPDFDTMSGADRGRLAALVHDLENQIAAVQLNEVDNLDAVRNAFLRFVPVIELARRHCNAQREATINALARAFQKPDYCIRRDSAGEEKDHYLPLAFAWDEDWYAANAVRNPRNAGGEVMMEIASFLGAVPPVRPDLKTEPRA